jgi:hypothetical protein
MAKLTHEERLYRYVFSVATSKSKLERTLRSHNEVRIGHLLKLYFYPEAQLERVGWERSVYSSLHSVPVLRNNKYPDAAFLYGEIWEKPFAGKLEEQFDRRVAFLSRMLWAYSPPGIPLEQGVKGDCCRICEDYSRNLAESLSVLGSLSWGSVRRDLEILFKTSKYVK